MSNTLLCDDDSRKLVDQEMEGKEYTGKGPRGWSRNGAGGLHLE